VCARARARTYVCDKCFLLNEDYSFGILL